jgi:phage/plasmid-associated DNA primase
MIRRCGYLTETNEHKRVLGEFKEDSDHTITFVKEFELNASIENSALYDVYKDWCYDNGYRAENKQKFLRLVAKHFKDLRKDIEPYRVKNGRGYKNATIL